MARGFPSLNVKGVPKRNALIAGGTLVALVAGATVVVVKSQGPELTLTAQVTEGSVSKMITAKGVASAAKSANLSFKRGDNISSIDVKVGDKVKKGQKLGELGTGSVRQAVLSAQGTLIQQQAALDLILNDVNPTGLGEIYRRAKDVADQAKKNIEIRYAADKKVYQRQEDVLKFDRASIRSAEALLEADGCTQDGKAKAQQFPQPVANAAPVPGPGTPSLTPYGVPNRAVFPNDPDQTTGPQSKCQLDYAGTTSPPSLQVARKTYFTDRTAFINFRNNAKVNRGVLRQTYRTALQAQYTAYNTYNIARVNRPNQIIAQKALVANAQTNVITAQSGLKNSYVYAPSDGTVAAIDGVVGEFNAGGSNLTPNTPLAAGGARIPTVGPLAANDARTFSGGTQLSAVNPSGGVFMQLADLNTFSVVAAYPEADVAQITNGSLSKVTFDAFPGNEYDGTVTAISPTGVLGPEGKTMYYATVLLNKAPEQLRSGMAANVSVVVATVQNKAYVVPTNAVQTSGDETYVYTPGQDGTPEKKVFTRGAVGDDNTQVVDGLKPGDTVLVPSTGKLPVAGGDAPKAAADSQPVPVIFDNPPPAQAAPAAAPAPAAMPAGGMDPAMMGDPALAGDPMLDGPDSLGGGDAMSGPATGGQIATPQGSANAGQAGVNPFASQPAPSAGN